MIARRDTLRLGLLSIAAAGGAGALSGCGSDPIVDPEPAGPDGEIELVSSDVRRAAGDPTVLPDVVAGLQGLTGGLYAGVAAEPGNVVISPYSVLVALGMTLVGAGGRTAEEMESVLGAGDLGARWHKGVNALTSYADGLAGKQRRYDGDDATIVLRTADQVFGQREVAWSGDFLDLLAKEYGAPIRAVDFAGATEDARLLINEWVADQTARRILDLVPEGALNTLTRLVLVNAVYLKAPWETPFVKEQTATGAFRRADGSTVDAELMRNPTLSGALARGEGWRAAVLPYAGRGLAMTVVLPDDGVFEAVEREMTGAGFAVATAGATPTTLDLTLPKWRFRTDVALTALLADLGMPTAFDADAADFTPMTDEDLPLHLDAVLHQGFIAVDEEGTEAAAATAVSVGTTSAPIAEELVVDRPFLFVIHDLQHAVPLFVGRVTDPTG